MSEEVLKVLANRTNQAILNLLAVEPTYPRKVGDLLSLSETEVARRLKHMESLGLVASSWQYIGKNVKLYRLVASSVSLRFTAGGLRMELSTGNAKATTEVLTPFLMSVPVPTEFVGRSRELSTLADGGRVVIVEGLPGIGKTSLVAQFAHESAKTRSVFWHSFRGVESLTWLANRCAVFLAQHGDR
ncbi:MAG: hypothetical protein ACT4PT_03705, partial [Methanobacteriota archaeon]